MPRIVVACFASSVSASDTGLRRRPPPAPEPSVDGMSRHTQPAPLGFAAHAWMKSSAFAYSEPVHCASVVNSTSVGIQYLCSGLLYLSVTMPVHDELVPSR